MHWQDAVEARTAELNVAYRRFRAITDSASDAIVSIDARGRIVFWNPRAATVFGYTDTEATGQYIDILVPDELRVRTVRRRSNASRRAKPNGSGARSKPRRCAATGRAWRWELSISRWSSDAEVFHTGIIRDMTERRRPPRRSRSARNSSVRLRKWRRWAGWPAAWRTTSTTC